MGNSIIKNPCFTGDNYAAAVASEPVPNDSLGHSFTYVRSGNAFDRPSMAASISSETSFFTLSGATISANSATTASFSTLNEMTWPPASACSFESSRSFAAVPLEAPSRLSFSGPILSMSGRFSDASGIMLTASDRLSGTLTRSSSASSSVRHHQPSISDLIAERRAARSRRRNERSILQFFVRTASRLRLGALRSGGRPAGLTKVESFSDGDYRSPPNDNVQWAQGMAGEDRFHVAVSEEHGWLFVGIYDGFNGPDAADYLFANLYRAVRDELKGVLWDEIQAGEPATGNAEHLCFVDAGNDSPEVDRKPKRGRTGWPEAGNATACGAPIHRQVLKALARALRKTEEAFFEAAEQRAAESPELGLMGSCVLVMLMKGRDVYMMNVGDSRAVLARRPEPDLKNILGKAEHDLQQFKAEIMRELEAHDRDGLQSVQLTPEHSTAAEEEVMRIRGQHLNDRNAIVNGRVKGKLQVTRAFGAGYLKEPKWNSRLLEAFKVNYIGTEPYISCIPSLCHHRICSNDKFLVLSSDGLYQYFTNKEVVDQVEMHTAKFPEGDPAKHLLDELVLRAARKAGMDCRELLDIPHGDRRRYHDDVSIIVVSLEGKIWRSSV